MTAPSSTQIVAVGQTGSGRTLVATWDGVRWRRETSPSPGSYAVLLGASASGPGRAWAVGAQLSSGGVFRTLALRTSP